jgi:hypothetical protein
MNFIPRKKVYKLKIKLQVNLIKTNLHFYKNNKRGKDELFKLCPRINSNCFC